VIALSDVTVLRDGPVRVVRGRLDDRAVIARLSAPTLPWLDPGSPAYGGAGREEEVLVERGVEVVRNPAFSLSAPRTRGAPSWRPASTASRSEPSSGGTPRRAATAATPASPTTASPSVAWCPTPRTSSVSSSDDTQAVTQQASSPWAGNPRRADGETGSARAGAGREGSPASTAVRELRRVQPPCRSGLQGERPRRPQAAVSVRARDTSREQPRARDQPEIAGMGGIPSISGSLSPARPTRDRGDGGDPLDRG
jgi:hypothetical protein